MKLEDLGYNTSLEKYRIENSLEQFSAGRVISEHKERYIVKTELCEYDSEIVGNLRFTADNRHDLPAVGDWVAISEYDENKALIHAVYPRTSILERKSVGKSGQTQIIATNIDCGIIVQAVDRDYNINRLERYLTICYTAKVKPVIVLSKIDLIGKDELKLILEELNSRIDDIDIITVSNLSQEGYERLKPIFIKSKTYCLLGSSGVGKSTLLNNFKGVEVMKTGSISTSVNKGKHITSHRELTLLDSGAILIDNPGMREVGITDATDGLEITFDTVVNLSYKCKFNNCTHVHESGCAILEALKNGEIDRDSFENYHKLQREKAHFTSTVAEKRKKDKDFGKMVKNHKNAKNHGKI